METGIRQGDEISIFYDPMIAKLVVWGKDRLQATQKLSYALQNFKIAGLVNNVAFLKKTAETEEFRSWDYDTSFIQKYKVMSYLRRELFTFNRIYSSTDQLKLTRIALFPQFCLELLKMSTATFHLHSSISE